MFSTERPRRKLLQASVVEEYLYFRGVTIPTFTNSHFFYKQIIFFLLVLKTVNRFPFQPFHSCQYRNLFKLKVALELQQSQLSVVKDKEAYNYWFYHTYNLDSSTS